MAGKYRARLKDGSEVSVDCEGYRFGEDGVLFLDNTGRQVACIPTGQLLWVAEHDKIESFAHPFPLPTVTTDQPSVVAGSGGSEPQ